MADNYKTDEEWITSKGDKAKKTNKPVYLEKQQREGWSAPIRMYLYWCRVCEIFSITHPAGYGRIHCKECGEHKKVMTKQRFRDKILKRPQDWLPYIGIPVLLIYGYIQFF